MDYESASATLGKPGGADLNLGLATGPALYAWEEHPEMGKLIQRKFKEAGDVEKVYLSFFVGQFLTHIFTLFHYHLRRGISFYVLLVYNARAH